MRRRWYALAVVAALAIVTAVVLVFTSQEPPLSKAYDTCTPDVEPPEADAIADGTSSDAELDAARWMVYASLGDEGRSLDLDGAGQDSIVGLTVDQIACVLLEVEAPDSVMSRMDGTRALDGMQEAEWSGLSASWTYHPDNGLDVILAEVRS